MKKFIKRSKTATSALIILIYVSLIAVLIAQALTPGKESAEISQSFGDKLNQAVTDIRQPVAEKIRVSEVKISSVTVGDKEYSHEDVCISVGSSGSINAFAYPDSATNRALIYSTDNEDVLAVYPDGRIVALSVGAATVTVSSVESPEYTASVKVTVKNVSLEKIEIHTSQDSLRIGESIRLDVEYYPKESNEREIIWQSSDSGVITIDEGGTLTAIGEGEAIIYAVSAKNGNITSMVSITVLPLLDDEVSLPYQINVTSPSSTYEVGDEVALKAELYPADAAGNIIWYSSDVSVVSVNQRGVIKCRKAGVAEITVRCGNLESKIKITVDEVLSKTIGFELNDISTTDGVYTIKQGRSGKVKAILDENATILDVKFASSNEEVAKIGADGVIEALRGGETVITISTSYGDKTTSVSFVLSVSRLTLEDTIDNFYHWVRKAMGHFGAFLVLGIFGSLTYYVILGKSLKGKLIACLVCIFAGFAVAGITEILQLPIFTPGRGPSFSDVMLDFAGYCTSTIPIYAIILLIHAVRYLVKITKMQKVIR